MGLFVDSNISTTEDLRAYDSQILTVANIEQVDLPTKLKLAEREIQVELQAILGRSSSGPNTQASPTIIDLSRVVVTEPLRQWHCLRTLVMVYQDVFHSQLNDRYEARWKEFLRLDQRTSALLRDTGLGLVSDPVPAARIPTVDISGGPMEPATYYIRVAWVNSGEQQGRPSETTAAIADTFHTLTVTAIEAPANAIGWNVYAGATNSTMAKQNQEVLLPGAVWTLPLSGLAAGIPPTEGQQPDYFCRPGGLLPRG